MHNRIDIAPYEQPGKYLVMVTLDEAFLTDPDTVSRCRRRFLSNRRRQLYQRCGRQLQLALEQLCELHYPLGRLINGAKYRSYIQFIMGSFLSSIAPDNITNSYLILYESRGTLPPLPCSRVSRATHGRTPRSPGTISRACWPRTTESARRGT